MLDCNLVCSLSEVLSELLCSERQCNLLDLEHLVLGFKADYSLIAVHILFEYELFEPLFFLVDLGVDRLELGLELAVEALGGKLFGVNVL